MASQEMKDLPDLMSSSSEEEVFEVEALLDRDTYKGKLHYFVKWKNYDEFDNSWEPIENLNKCFHLVQEYDAKNWTKRPKKRRRPYNKRKSKIALWFEPLERKEEETTETRSVSASKETVQEEVPDATQPETEPDQISASNGKETVNMAVPDATDSETEPEQIWTPKIKKSKLMSDANRPGRGYQGEKVAAFSIMAPSVFTREDQEQLDLIAYGPMYRRFWRQSEIPFRVLGTTYFQNSQVLLVRLKPPNADELQLEALQLNPHEGVDDKNCVVVDASSFRLEFPQLLIKFYEKTLKIVEDKKTPDQITDAAARALLFHNFWENKMKVDGAPIFNDMMGGDPNLHKPGEYLIDQTEKIERSRSNWSMSKPTGPRSSQNMKKFDNGEEDGFGLPKFFDSSDEENLKENSETGSDDEDDDDHEWEYEAIDINSLKTI